MAVYGTLTNEWNGAQFHFHAGSEHTVDGKRHDLEMHTVHFPGETTQRLEEDPFIAAAMGVMFSVNDANVQITAE